MIFDKQYAFAIIVIILGFGIMQTGGNDSDSFLVGAGVGTIAIGMFWLAFRLIQELKNPKSKSGK